MVSHECQPTELTWEWTLLIKEILHRNTANNTRYPCSNSDTSHKYLQLIKLWSILDFISDDKRSDIIMSHQGSSRELRRARPLIGKGEEQFESLQNKHFKRYESSTAN
jgi:hypothetical protein